MGHSPLKITACNISSTVLRHQPVPPSLSSPHLKKRQNSSPFLLLLLFSPTKKNLPGLHLFFLNCFLFLMLKASAGQLGSMLRCQLFQQCCPCGCAQGWPQLPGHYRTLCMQAGAVRSRTALLCPAGTRGTAQHGCIPRKSKSCSGSCACARAGALHLADLLGSQLGPGSSPLAQSMSKHTQVCTQHSSQRLADSFPTQLGAQTSAGAGHQAAGFPQPNWSHPSLLHRVIQLEMKH